MVHGISGNNGANPIFTKALQNSGNVSKSGEIKTSTPVQITSTNSLDRANLADTVANLSGRAQVNAPSAQGLASAEQVCNGQLVSGYHFESLGDVDTRLFTIKYNSANTPQIANGTNYACEGIEYAEVASHLQSANSPFAELFS